MTPRSLARRFAALSALRWLPVGLTVPVLVLLVTARGLDVAAVGALLAVYSAVTLLLELPTGGLADVIGRRPVLVASSLASAAGSVLFGVGTDVPALLAAAVLLAVGRALGSGPLEAWYVDTARRDDPAADIRGGLSAARTAEAAALGIGAVAGGLIPGWVASAGAGGTGGGTGPVLPLSVPFLLAAGLFAVNAGAVLALVGRSERSPGTVAATVRDGLAVARGSAGVRRLLGFSATLGFTLSGIELLSPGHVAGLLGGPEAGVAAYGLLVAVGFGASAAGAWLAPTLVRGGGPDPARRWAVGLTVAAAVTVCLVGAPVFGVVATAYSLTYLLLGAGGPLVAEMLHDRVAERLRSTILSLESLTLQTGGLVASLATGALADRVGVWPALAVVAAVLAVGAALLSGVRRSAPG